MNFLKSLTVGTLTAGAIAFGGMGQAFAEPASPVTSLVTSTYYGPTQAQFDNNPGNGGTSWVWVYSGDSSGRLYAGAVDYEDYNGNVGRAYVSAGKSFSFDPGRDIWRIRACNYENHGAGYNYYCGGWS